MFQLIKNTRLKGDIQMYNTKEDLIYALINEIGLWISADIK